MRYLLLFCLFCAGKPLVAQAQFIDQIKDSLITASLSETSDTVLFDIYQQIALGYRFLNLDSTAKYTTLAKQSINGANYPIREATAIGYETFIAFMKGNYDESLDLSDELLSIIDGIDTDEATAIRRKTLNDQGTMYAALGMYELGLSKFYELYELYEKEDTRNESYYVALSNIGVMYNRLEYFENALEIFLRLDEEMPVEYESRMSVPVNLGFIYYDLKEFEKSKFHLKEALAQEGNIDPRVYGLSNFKLGQVHNAEGNFEYAIDAFESSIQIYKDQNNELETVQSINGLARAHLGLNQLIKAYNYGLEGLEIANRYNAIPERQEVLESLYIISKERNNFEEALAYHEQLKEVSEFITTSETTSEIERLTAEHEFLQKEEKLIAENREKELISNAKIKQQQILIYASISIIFFAALGMIGMYRNFSQKRESNHLLSLKNQEIQDQAEKLQELNRVKDRIFSMIAHDLRGPLSSLYGVISLIDMKKTSTKELEVLIPSVAQRFKYTSTLLNNLLHWAQSQMQGYSVNPEVFDISHTVFNKKTLLQTSIEEKNISFSFDDSEFLVYADLNMIDVVIQNLISNAIKYCNSGDEINIYYTKEEENAIIIVKDSGIGIEDDAIEKLFSKTFYTTPGTNKEKGTGLGLMLCLDFVEKNGGKLWIESEIDKGTTIRFTLPLASEQMITSG